ncbi:SpoIID/LytB domain-containing protein [Cyanobium sp. WAJ14-Wanaka]|uniref:SpoIID/LytB domain-containing protein n=1 Tax=Cyanobium sp. WAJ14-Wanaka TaxID=2823725 RepID=UPI0020CE6832|nr:SpoIID/LytB domain-containing protein [Cyanobium sp. WAJ14-Wanaka]MCP9775180.1 SpoIID/LytB domain-containing protein [Cyanobium sp. WAJ14-Wanaka]
MEAPWLFLLLPVAPPPSANLRSRQCQRLWGLLGGLGLASHPALALAQEGPLQPAPTTFGAIQRQYIQSQDSREPTVRVLLAEGPSLRVSATDYPLALRLVGGAGAAGERQVIAPGAEISLSLEAGSVLVQADPGGPTTVLSVREIWIEPLDSGFSLGVAKPGGDFALKQRSYRGRLQLLVNPAMLQAINHVGLESYLTSVVGSEMPASWPQAALRAQAVAARTYALRQRSAAKAFDVSSTVASQVYKGVEAETPSTREAVAKTRGQVLMYGPSLVNAVFHSSSGGSTENSGDLWREQLPYLVSVPDVDQESPVARWQLQLEPQALRKAFAETGGASRIDVLSTTPSGRVRQARVVGPLGTLVVTGPELRSRLGLRSTMVHFQLAGPVAIDPDQAILPVLPPPLVEPQPSAAPTLMAIGRGFGHGVGMSQWGAYALALRGEDYPQILRYYFRGTELKPYAAP